MDEAFSALDPLIRAGLQTEVLALQAETGRTIVFVTQDLDEALRLGHRLAILHEGRVLQVGTPDELLMQPADDHVAAFVRGVNRARAWTIGAALAPWPPHLALSPLEDAVDDTLTIEQVLPRLAGRAEALAVRRGGRIAGCVDVDKLQRMLDQRGPWRAPERPPSTDDLVRAQQQIARQHQADGVGSRPI